MPRQEFAIVHSIQMIAGQDQQSVDAPVAYVRQHLAHGVGGSLEPFAAFRGLLSREHLDKSISERREAIRGGNVPVERRRIVLGQHEHPDDVRVDAIRNRHIDQTVLSTQRHGRL